MKHLAKWISLSALLVLTLMVLAACGSSNTETTTAKETETTLESASSENAATESVEETTEEEMLVLTLEELSTYNGQNGNPAYVAVDGVIYDVTNAGPWSGGQHNGFEAGQDLTEEIKSVSPHGVSKLEGVPVVGTLSDN